MDDYKKLIKIENNLDTVGTDKIKILLENDGNAKENQ